MLERSKEKRTNKKKIPRQDALPRWSGGNEKIRRKEKKKEEK